MKVFTQGTFLKEDSFPNKKDKTKKWFSPKFLVDNSEIAEGFSDEPCYLESGEVVDLVLEIDLKDKKLKYVNVVKES